MGVFFKTIVHDPNAAMGQPNMVEAEVDTCQAPGCKHKFRNIYDVKISKGCRHPFCPRHGNMVIKGKKCLAPGCGRHYEPKKFLKHYQIVLVTVAATFLVAGGVAATVFSCGAAAPVAVAATAAGYSALASSVAFSIGIGATAGVIAGLSTNAVFKKHNIIQESMAASAGHVKDMKVDLTK